MAIMAKISTQTMPISPEHFNRHFDFPQLPSQPIIVDKIANLNLLKNTFTINKGMAISIKTYPVNATYIIAKILSLVGICDSK